MEKIKLTTTDPAEELEVYVLEETTINQQKYLLVAEEETGDCEAFILKLTGEEQEDYTYVPEEDEVELSAVRKVYEEPREDPDFER